MKIAVLASGGVDSSVVLKLLKEQGHEVTAFYLKIWLEDELSFLGNCPWEEDLSYLRQICKKEGILLEIVNLQKEYHQEVVSYALKEIKAGRTPNSDLLCNSKVKFGRFYEVIGDEFDAVASGHYADKRIEGKNHLLKRAKDSFKDQTYFLAHLGRKQLQKAMFPLGPYLKKEVREMAKKYDLPNQKRKDSQGICFLGQIKYNEFVKHHLGEQKGDLIEYETDKKLGEHKGYWFFTVGQRKGIELSGGPWYVVKKDPQNNKVYISNTYHDLSKKRDCFKVEGLHWISGEPTKEQFEKLKVKIRHGEEEYNATFKSLGDKKAEIRINSSDQGLAAGQFAVFYSGDICLGCGTII